MTARATVAHMGFALALICGCASTPTTEAIVVDGATTTVAGWLSTTGQWAVYQNRRFESYSPYGLAEEKKCVTLVNGTGIAAETFAHLEGHRVVVSGQAIRYDALPIGPSSADRLMSKRYFGGDLVEDYCWREWVFVAREIKPQ